MSSMVEAIILGILQGLTEFFPISSTAHLVLLPEFLGWSGPVDTLGFDIALHGGTLLALLILLRGQIIGLFKKDRRLLFGIALATIPAGVTGIFLDEIVASNLRTPVFIALTLSVFGAYMYVSERKTGGGTLRSIGLREALIIGLSQAVAVLPGVSRSGITIATALFLGIRREDAARFSFLLSIPVIGGAVTLELPGLVRTGAGTEISIIIAGVTASFISGLFALTFLLWFFRRATLRPFVYYRLLLAVIIIVITLS